MSRLKISLFVLIIIILFGKFSCGKWDNYLRDQEINIKPSTILSANHSIAFEMSVGVPAPLINKMDSIQYQLFLMGNPKYIHVLTIINKEISENDQMIYLREKIETNATLRKDTTDLIVKIEYFKNGLSRKLYDEIPIGKIIRN